MGNRVEESPRREVTSLLHGDPSSVLRISLVYTHSRSSIPRSSNVHRLPTPAMAVGVWDDFPQDKEVISSSVPYIPYVPPSLSFPHTHLKLVSLHPRSTSIPSNLRLLRRHSKRIPHLLSTTLNPSARVLPNPPPSLQQVSTASLVPPVDFPLTCVTSSPSSKSSKTDSHSVKRGPQED